MYRVAFQLFSYLVGLPLQALIVIALLRGMYRHYPFVFGYAVASLLASALEAILYAWGLFDKDARPIYVTAYWINEQILLALIYTVVISMIVEATARARSRRIVKLLVIAGPVLFAAITFGIHFARYVNFSVLMTSWTRELYFCAAILDLGLWAMLIGAQKKDHRVLVLSGALGIMFTGEGIGESVRQLSISSRSDIVKNLGDIVIMLSNLVFLYLWWSAFRTTRVDVPNSTPPAPASLTTPRAVP